MNRRELKAPTANFDAVTYPVEENPYRSVYVDVTTRCNMRCAFCYNNADADGEDISVEEFTELCRRLPSQTVLKFMGGEPTLHPHFADLLRIAYLSGHTVYSASNGLRYNDPDFIAELKAVQREGVRFTLGLSMDGGYSNRRAYEHINGVDCCVEKVRAFHSITKARVARVMISAIIVRGLNEKVMNELYMLAMMAPAVIRYIHYRNVAKVGRFQDTEPYTMPELKAMAANIFSAEQMEQKYIGEWICQSDSGCCYRFQPTRRLQVSLIEFGTERAALCPNRGKYLNGQMKVQSFFENMLSGEVALEKYKGEQI